MKRNPFNNMVIFVSTVHYGIKQKQKTNHSADPKLSQQLNPPSVYSKNKTWYDRSQYGNILRGLISSQLTQFKREKNRIKKTRISQNVGYLIQVMASLINQEKNVEERLEQLEQMAGIAKKGVITK